MTFDPNFARHVSYVPLVIQALIGNVTDSMVAVSFSVMDDEILLYLLFSEIGPLEQGIIHEVVGELEAQLGSFTPIVIPKADLDTKLDDWIGKHSYRVFYRYDGFLDETYQQNNIE